MTKFMKLFGKMCFMVLCLAIGSKEAGAAVYTAVASGNFNTGLTWGGSAPGALLSTDIVVIPAGIVVTMTGNEAFTGTSSLTVSGTLTGSPGATLSMTSGTLAGAGIITADSIALGLVSGFTYTGTLVANKLTSLGLTLHLLQILR